MLSNEPSSAVTVCEALPWLAHTIVVPRTTVILLGAKLLSTTATLVALALGAGTGAGAGALTTAFASTGASAIVAIACSCR